MSCAETAEPINLPFVNRSICHLGCGLMWGEESKVKLYSPGGQAGTCIYNQTDHEEYYFALGCRCSVFQAEIYAILQCAKLYSLHCRNSASVTICSDSQAALKAPITTKVNSALVAETVCAPAELSVHNSVRLVWTPGH